MKLYILEMLRHGDREKHSYVVGAFDNLDQALKEGVTHEIHRAGKYEFAITTVNLNEYTTYSNETVKDLILQDGEEEFTQHVVARTLGWLDETDGKNLFYDV